MYFSNFIRSWYSNFSQSPDQQWRMRNLEVRIFEADCWFKRLIFRQWWIAKILRSSECLHVISFFNDDWCSYTQCLGAKVILWYCIGTLRSGRTLRCDVWLTCMDFYRLRFCGSFCRICFLPCRIVRSLMITLTCSRVFSDGSFFMALVSSMVSLWILSALVIFGVWKMWWLNWIVLVVLSAPVFLTLLCSIGNVSCWGRHTMHRRHGNHRIFLFEFCCVT